MGYQWMEMRIEEEQDRRQREALIQEQLPHALDDGPPGRNIRVRNLDSRKIVTATVAAPGRVEVRF